MTLRPLQYTGRQVEARKAAMGNVHSLGPEEIGAYRRDGYVHLPGFFSSREVAPICEAIAP